MVIATGLVAAAGAVAWFGYAPPEATPVVVAAPGETATIPADASPTRAPGRAAMSGLPTRVRVESAGIDASVVEVGVVNREGKPAWETAWSSAGHHMDSALPGNPGNVVLTGHVSVANASSVPVFAGLDRVQVGDIVEVYSGSKVHQYRISEIRKVPPAAVEVLRGDHRSLVTLITCTKDLGHRLVVVGSLVGEG